MGKGKFWGYDRPRYTIRWTNRSYLGSDNTKGPCFKLPTTRDIQRVILARHMMYLSNPLVYRAKTTRLDFEEHVKQYKKFPLAQRVPTAYNNWKNRMSIRRKGDLVDDLADEEESLRATNDKGTEFDFEALSFKPLPINLTVAQRAELKPFARRRKWLKWAFVDLHSAPINEIVSNHRLVTLDDSSIHHNQSHFTIFLESARNALKTHQWPVLNQCVLAMVRTLPTTIKCPTVLWTLGFIAIINHYKNDHDVLQRFLEQATILIRGFRSWLGIQVGIWLIQKGYFNEGFELVKEWHTKPCRESGLAFLSKQHPKKHMVLYLGEFIMAMMRYSTWKRDILAIRQEEDNLLGHGEDEESVERAGNIALTSFEYVYQYQTDTNADVMSFIEPFVELLIEYRSVNRAKEIVEEVYERNPGNMFVEKFYFSFLEQHFPHECATEEFSERNEKFNNKYTYEKDPSEAINGRLKFNKWKADRKRDGNIVRLKQLPTPDFAWD